MIQRGTGATAAGHITEDGMPDEPSSAARSRWITGTGDRQASSLEPIHAVQFYEDDEVLFKAVAEFLSEGLRGEDSVIVIATGEHGRAFCDKLASRGADIAGLQRSGRLTLLDAHQTLSKFMRDGEPDPELFDDVIGQLIENAVGALPSPGRVRAYGEMVDLLWREGHKQSAIELEGLWNGLQRRHCFELLCAYGMAGFYKAPAEMRHVCRTHTHVRADAFADERNPSPISTPVVASAEPEAPLAREIARRHELECALREALRKVRSSEEQLVDFIDNAPIGLHSVSSDGKILWANRAELDLLGYTEEEYVGRAIGDFHVDQRAIADVLRRLSRGEQLRDHAAQLRARDGSIKHVLISSNAHFKDGRFAYTRCITKDISQTRKAEHAASEREEQIRIIADALPVLISLVDADQRYRFVSANHEHWFHISTTQFIGRRLDEVLGRAAYEQIKAHMEKALAGVPARYEAEVPYRDSGMRWVETHYLPVRSPDGSVTGVVTLMADISERRALEAARGRAAARAERLLKVTAAIAEAVSSDEVFEAIVDQVAETIGASTGALWLVDEESRSVKLVRSRGYHETAKRQFDAVSLDTAMSFPALDCIRRGKPIWIDSQAMLLEHYPHLGRVTTPGRSYRVACLPLSVHGRVLGALGLTSEEAREPSEEEHEFLRLVSSYASQALERLRLLDLERQIRAEATAAAERLGVLSHASRTFADSDLGLEARLRAVVMELSDALGSVVNLALLGDDGFLHLTAVQHPNPHAQSQLQALAPSTPLRLGEGITGTIAATGRSIILPTIDPQMLTIQAAPAYRAFLEQFPAYALIGTPLKVRGRVVGTATATRIRPGDSYTIEDLGLLEELAHRGAAAIENARLYEQTLEARRTAEHLYCFAQAAVIAADIDVVYEAALHSLEAALGVKRAAILTLDTDGTMRFRAWHGLSSTYRAAVEGHSPWSADVVAPQPVLVSDALSDAAMSTYASLFREEGIGALAFVPLVTRGRLLGKFMVYYELPHAFAPQEVETARAIANHLASEIGRFAAVSKLEETVRHNELFAAVLAHDLRNPLGAITTAAQLMLMRMETASGNAEGEARPLARILSSSQRMSVMIDQLLDFTRARAGGGLEVNPCEADLATLLQQAVGELELTHPKWTIHCDIQGDACGTWDSHRLLQVISNLIANAGHHGASGAPIIVRLDGSDSARVSLEVHNAGAIPAELLPHLFVPFRTTQHRRAGARGLGLGLFIIREIVHAHGGRVEVTSADAIGTKLRVELPRHVLLSPESKKQPGAARPLATSVMGVAPPEAATGRGAASLDVGAKDKTTRPPTDSASVPTTVLVVDDDLDIREALTEILQHRGITVIGAPNGAEALQLLRTVATPPNVVLLDLMMPVMDGYEFLDARRNEPLLAAIPVIVVTASHGVDRARLGPATPVLPKPIEVAHLMNTLQQLGAAGGPVA